MIEAEITEITHLLLTVRDALATDLPADRRHATIEHLLAIAEDAADAGYWSLGECQQFLALMTPAFVFQVGEA